MESNPDLFRFTYTYAALMPTKNVERISGGDGSYRVELTEDSKHQDIGRAIGQAFVKAGYAIIGVHQHYSDGDSIDVYTFVDIESVGNGPRDYFLDELNYDAEEDAFTRGYPEGEL